MKIKTFPSILALLLLSIAAPSIASAQSASGDYQFSFDDGYTKTLQFDARQGANGSATGQMFLSDEATVVYRDVDGAGDPEGKYPGFYVKANFDGMVVNKNQAVMSGTIFDSSIRDLIGKRVLLTVEDNGNNTNVPDKLTWGLYKPVVRDWTPSDSELKEDPGVGLRWWATDAEVKDDRGFQMPRDESITTNSYPLEAYAFVDIDRFAGDIVVQP